MRRFLNLAAVLLLAALGLMMPQQAMAGSHGSIYAGYDIAPLVHGQMPVVAGYRGKVLALAAEVAPDDPLIVALTEQVNTQYAKAYYGMVPMALADVESPFHLATHGYLAATMALMKELKAVAPDNPRVLAMARAMDYDLMMAGQMGMESCAYSQTMFKVGEFVGPDWSLLRTHRSTQLFLAVPGLLALMLGGLIGLVLVRRRPNMGTQRLLAA